MDDSHKDQYTFMIKSRSIFHIMINLSDKIVKKIATHFMFRNLFPKIVPLLDNVEK